MVGEHDVERTRRIAGEEARLTAGGSAAGDLAEAVRRLRREAAEFRRRVVDGVVGALAVGEEDIGHVAGQAELERVDAFQARTDRVVLAAELDRPNAAVEA